MVCHGLVEKSHGQEVQHRVLPRWLPVQGSAATLRRGFQLSLLIKKERAMATSAKRPSRLHHTAYVTRDLEATRAFYEDVIGLPLVATWCEIDELFGAR